MLILLEKLLLLDFFHLFLLFWVIFIFARRSVNIDILHIKLAGSDRWWARLTFPSEVHLGPHDPLHFGEFILVEVDLDLVHVDLLLLIPDPVDVGDVLNVWQIQQLVHFILKGLVFLRGSFAQTTKLIEMWHFIWNFKFTIYYNLNI
jgi:hypothetical protein